MRTVTEDGVRVHDQMGRPDAGYGPGGPGRDAVLQVHQVFDGGDDQLLHVSPLDSDKWLGQKFRAEHAEAVRVFMAGNRYR